MIILYKDITGQDQTIYIEGVAEQYVLALQKEIEQLKTTTTRWKLASVVEQLTKETMEMVKEIEEMQETINKQEEQIKRYEQMMDTQET